MMKNYQYSPQPIYGTPQHAIPQLNPYQSFLHHSEITQLCQEGGVTDLAIRDGFLQELKPNHVKFGPNYTPIANNSKLMNNPTYIIHPNQETSFNSANGNANMRSQTALNDNHVSGNPGNNNSANTMCYIKMENSTMNNNRNITNDTHISGNNTDTMRYIKMENSRQNSNNQSSGNQNANSMHYVKLEGNHAGIEHGHYSHMNYANTMNYMSYQNVYNQYFPHGNYFETNEQHYPYQQISEQTIFNSMQRKSDSTKAAGLSYYSQQIVKFVKEQGETNYPKVADAILEIIKEQHKDSNKPIKNENVRRRVYDALNVLCAAKIIERNSLKELKWIGFSPIFKSSRHYESLAKERNERKKNMHMKIEYLQELSNKLAMYRQLIEYNKKRSITNFEILYPSFMIIQTNPNTRIQCEMTEDKTSYFFNFSYPFSVHDDNQILSLMAQSGVFKQDERSECISNNNENTGNRDR
eukprot:TRINITY_DN9915_c0_g1_i1.p1 TRINITY_DN9915_c0_g1~~TRINITY_DN9915_c0_g1_i1.p1  ORF type:complete len:468 (+),score=64.77 TRINITY_DN9915_c0_g1_i1:48-1451(+)